LDRPASVPGIPFKSLDAKSAVPACEAAVLVAPDDRRIVFQLGRAYGVAKDFEKERAQLARADALGSLLAANNLGSLYKDGLGGARDVAEARRLYEKAAAGGIALAMVNVGRVIASGEAGPKDFKQALSWYQKAAALGYAPAMTRIGWVYTKGEGVARDF